MRKTGLVVTLAALFVFPGTIFAQSVSEKVSVEGVFGAGYTNPTYFVERPGGYDFLFGGRVRVSLAPEKGNFLDRVGGLFGLEYTPVSSMEFNDPSIGRAKSSESKLVIKTGLSLSVVRRDRFELLLNGGAAFTRNHLAFSTPNSYSFGGWQNICVYLEKGVCKSSWSIRGSFEPEVRIYPKGREKHFYFGTAVDIPLRRIGLTIGGSW